MTPHPEHHPAPAPSPPPAQQIEEQIELPQQIAQQQNVPRRTYDLRRRQPVRELAQGERNQGLAARSAPSRRRRRRVRAAPLRASAGRAAGPAEALNAAEQENPVVEEENPVVEEENPVPEVTQCASSTADENVNFPVPNSPIIADPSPDVNTGMASLNDIIELNKTQILKGRLLTVVTPSVLFDVLLDTLPTQDNPVDKDQIMPDFENKLNAKLGGNPVDGSLHFDHALEMLQSNAHRNAVNVQTDQGKIWIVLPNADPDLMQHLENFWGLKKQRSQL